MVIGLALLAPACGSEGPSVVARAGRWVLTIGDLEREYARLHPERSFWEARPEDREDFLRDVVNNELLLGVAKREVDHFRWRIRRRIDVDSENWLVETFFREMMNDFRVSDEDYDRVLDALRREAHVQRIVAQNMAAAQDCYRRLMQGLSFEEGYYQYSLKTDEPRTEFDLGYIKADRIPWRAVRQVFLSGMRPGDISPPIQTQKGLWILKLVGLRPATLDPREQRRIRASIRWLCLEDSVEVRRDELSRAAGYRLFEENFPVINRCFDAYWDSMSAENPRANEAVLMSWRAPSWLLAPEERDLPIYEFYGTTGTALDFMESLNSVHSLQWPSAATGEQRYGEIRKRIRRLFLKEEAVRRGFDKRPEFEDFMERRLNEAYLDEYYESSIAPEINVTPEEAEAEYDRDPGRYRTPEKVAIAVLVFPPERESQARAFAEQHASAEASVWFQAARTVAATDTSILFIRDTGLLNLEQPLEDPGLEPFVEIARRMETGQSSGVTETSEGYAIIRCNFRKEGKPLPRDIGVPLAEGEVRKRKTDERIQSVLDEAAQRRRLRIYPERVRIQNREPEGT